MNRICRTLDDIWLWARSAVRNRLVGYCGHQPGRCRSHVAKPSGNGRLQLDSVVLTLIEQVEVSARQTGLLDQIAVAEGQTVKEGDLLAALEDNDQRLAVDKARIEAEIAAKQAASDVKPCHAKKTYDVATAEEKRAAESAEKFSKSVSQTELDELRLTREKASLEAEQATEDRDVARLTAELSVRARWTRRNTFLVAARSIARWSVSSFKSSGTAANGFSRATW